MGQYATSVVSWIVVVRTHYEITPEITSLLVFSPLGGRVNRLTFNPVYTLCYADVILQSVVGMNICDPKGPKFSEVLSTFS
jgi:hypothetical protein